MQDLVKLQKQQNQTFILVCINFVLFMVLFTGLGYVSWQSATLVNRLKGELDKAERTIVELQKRFRNIDTDILVDRLATTASERIDQSIKNVVQESDFSVPLTRVSERMAATQEVIEQVGKAMQGIHETVKRLDNDEIARLVSYHILTGLGDGFHKAAAANKPAGAAAPIPDSSNSE